MITFLASPKPFVGPMAGIQAAAMRSWLSAAPGAEVLLYGRAAGAAEACAAVGARHVPGVEATPEGVPYFGAIATHARRWARHDLQVYVNCDILLAPAIAEVARHIEWPQFLLIGQRLDLAEGAVLDVCRSDWRAEMIRLAQERRLMLHGPTGIDYFGFRRGMWEGILPLVIGRATFDGALIAYCLRRRIPVIDGTLAVAAFHQHHDYGHVPGGVGEVFGGADARRNSRLHGVARSTPGIGDATWELRGAALIRNACRGDRLRAAELHWRFEAGRPLFALGLRFLWRALARASIIQPKTRTLEEVLAALQSSQPDGYRSRCLG